MEKSSKHGCLNCTCFGCVQTSAQSSFTKQYNNFYSIWIAILFINIVEMYLQLWEDCSDSSSYIGNAAFSIQGV